MILESWRIASTHLGSRWWRVAVHDSQASMNKAGRRTHPWLPAEFWQGECWGLCQPVSSRIRVFADGTEDSDPVWPGNHYAGVIRLLSEKLYPEVVYHEVAHAACAVYRMNTNGPVDLGDGEEEAMRSEEDFAYIFGQLAADMDSEIRRRAA
jgi:hypothetical protein